MVYGVEILYSPQRYRKRALRTNSIIPHSCQKFMSSARFPIGAVYFRHCTTGLYLSLWILKINYNSISDSFLTG